MYCTSIQVSDRVRLDLFTTNSFRTRRSDLRGERFPAWCEIPFAVGHTDPWKPVEYTVEDTAINAIVRTSALTIYCRKDDGRVVLETSAGNRIFPCMEPKYGMFKNKCIVFDSATFHQDYSWANRFCHWFYNPETGLYDRFLQEDSLLDTFYIWADNYDDGYRLYNELVGPEPMLMRKGYGFYQIQFYGAKGNQRMLLKVADTFREKGIPCDTLILDYEWGDGVDSLQELPWGSRLDWQSEYSKPLSVQEMLSRLREQHYEVMLIHHNIPSYEHRMNEGWVSEEYAPDLWWSMMKKHIDEGAHGTWQDTRMTDISNARVYTGLQKMLGEGERAALCGDYELYYDCNWTKDCVIEPILQKIGGRRYPFGWTGDMAYTSWEELEFQIRGITNEHGSLKGISHLTNDCMRAGPQDLSIRSAQFLAFNTIARAHNTKPWQRLQDANRLSELMAIKPDKDDKLLNTTESEDQMLGLIGQDELQTEVIRKYLKIRYRLIPYLYTFVRQCYDTGMPVCRPLMIAFPNDPACNANQFPAQYMFGSEILVAPVYRADGRMNIYLPVGTDWVDYWSHEIYIGGQIIQIVADDLTKMPLFVKAGAVLPMRQSCDWIERNEVLTDLYLDIYPGPSSTFTLYEDDGISLDYQKGRFSKSILKNQVMDSKMLLTIGKAVGEYTGKPSMRHIIVRWINIARNPHQSFLLNGANCRVEENGDVITSITANTDSDVTIVLERKTF